MKKTKKKKISINEKHSVKKNQAKQICMQMEKLTSFYGKTQRESDMGNFKVFAADMPAGPASFQKSLFIGTSSLFDWFEIISCKPQNYLFILFNGPLQRQRVQSNYQWSKSTRYSIELFLLFDLYNSQEHSAVLKKRAIELLNNKSTRFDYK